MLERYSCIYDLLYLAIMHVVTRVLPSMVVSIVSFVFCLIDQAEFKRLVSPFAFFIDPSVFKYSTLMLENQLHLVCLIVYYIC